MSYHLGNHIGFRESLEEEFKEFILKLDPHMYLEDSEIKTIIETGVIEDMYRFNSMIVDNIAHYFKYYIPKYLSCFGNSKLKHANLYIGTNDFGEITGVPFFGSLTSENIKSFLEVVRPFVSIDKTETDISDLLSKVKIEVIKLNKDTDYLDDNIDTILKEYQEKKKKIETEYFENLQLRRTWKEKMDKYTTRILDYANKPEFRKEVIEYIKRSGEADTYNKIIELLESKEEIPIGDGVEIGIRKMNKHDVVHWVTEYKDMMVDLHKSQRPIRMGYLNYGEGFYTTQLSLLNNMRYRFVNNNSDMNYYLIKISFPTDFTSKVYFKTHDMENWLIRTRTIVNDSPGCL
jgi:hypothetical protein